MFKVSNQDTSCVFVDNFLHIPHFVRFLPLYKYMRDGSTAGCYNQRTFQLIHQVKNILRARLSDENCIVHIVLEKNLMNHPRTDYKNFTFEGLPKCRKDKVSQTCVKIK